MYRETLPQKKKKKMVTLEFELWALHLQSGGRVAPEPHLQSILLWLFADGAS
jgi:hypothetical protein